MINKNISTRTDSQGDGSNNCEVFYSKAYLCIKLWTKHHSNALLESRSLTCLVAFSFPSLSLFFTHSLSFSLGVGIRRVTTGGSIVDCATIASAFFSLGSLVCLRSFARHKQGIFGNKREFGDTDKKQISTCFTH